jgi:hypothetical protein
LWHVLACSDLQAALGRMQKETCHFTPGCRWFEEEDLVPARSVLLLLVLLLLL